MSIDDLIAELRSVTIGDRYVGEHDAPHPACQAAADEITRLQSLNAELVGALEMLTACVDHEGDPDWDPAINRARTVLSKTKGGI